MESYQFIKQIGQGNYGEVWLVKCSKTRRKYVLKQFDLHRSSKREQRASYLEAKLLSTLKHPNIVAYLDSFYNSKGSLFIVMGYCECGDLCSYIRSRNGVHFEEKEVINWFVQICMALKYLHDKSILHRDLKTKNIFLTRNKLIKVGDLGIARVLKAAEEMATTLIGTPYYMSPEIFRGKPYNQKSDVWALGCCMYEIATLERAFDARDIHTLMQKVTRGKVPSLPDIYSGELFHIIASMLNHDPEERPSVTELLLNDFIRKYILLFLQESPSKCRSSSKNSCSSSKSTESTPTSRGWTNILLRHSDKIEKPSVVKKDTTTSSTSESVTTIPDSNGNGDGNDNSQQQAMNNEGGRSAALIKKKRSGIRPLHCQSKTDNSNQAVPAKTKGPTLVAEYQSTLKETSVESSSTTKQSRTIKSRESSSDSITSIAQKQKSQNSFNILNNLAYTIKNSRFENWEQRCDGHFPSTTKTKYFCGMDPPKSAEELYLRSRNPVGEHSNRNTQSAGQDLASVSYVRYRNQCHFPQISKSEVEVCASKLLGQQLNLPYIESLKTCKNINTTPDCQDTSRDCVVDKLLLQNIMECNEMVQTSAIPFQSYKDMQKLSRMKSSSAPTSIDLLSSEDFRKEGYCSKGIL